MDEFKRVSPFFWRRYRVVLAALLLSLAAHGALVLFSPQFYQPGDDQPGTRFMARLTAPPPSGADKHVQQSPARTIARRVTLSGETIEDVEVIKRPLPLPGRRATAETVASSGAGMPSAARQIDSAARQAPAPHGKPVATLPGRIDLEYELKSSLVDGRADYSWRRDGNHYSIDGSIEANGFFATMFVGRMEQTSRGELIASGLKPEFFTLKRGEDVTESAEFIWNEKLIRHRRLQDQHTQPLQDGAQDLLSFIFQFAYEFPEKLVHPGQVAFSITNARKLNRYEFRVVGEEKLTLPIGETSTIHLIRQTSDPTDTYEAWLATDHYFLPVKLRFMLGGRVYVDQIAVSLTSNP